MPAQQCVRRRDRGDLPQGRTAHPVRPRSQSSAIVVGETQSPGHGALPIEQANLIDVVRLLDWLIVAQRLSDAALWARYRAAMLNGLRAVSEPNGGLPFWTRLT